VIRSYAASTTILLPNGRLVSNCPKRAISSSGGASPDHRRDGADFGDLGAAPHLPAGIFSP
jgi:hypothetical protein